MNVVRSPKCSPSPKLEAIRPRVPGAAAIATVCTPMRASGAIACAISGWLAIEVRYRSGRGGPSPPSSVREASTIANLVGEFTSEQRL